MNSPESRTASALANVSPVIIIDNYDSFTYNIKTEFARIGVDAVVYRNDQITIDEIRAMDPRFIVISPGPGTPENPEDVGVSNDVIDYCIAEKRASLLGVCLGHQAIAHRLGGNIVRAPEILHGKMSTIHKKKKTVLFDGIENDPTVMRYHSLIAEEDTLPKELRVTARTSDNHRTIMAVEHRDAPVYGVQFHPESFGTPDGPKILENFLATNPEAFALLKERGVITPEYEVDKTPLPAALSDLVHTTEVRQYELKEFPCALPPEEVYARLHAASSNMYTFESLDPEHSEGNRYSYFGADPEFVISARNEKIFLNDEEIPLADGVTPFDALNATVERIRERATGEVDEAQHLSGGFVGYMSYEALQYREPTVLPPGGGTPEDEKTFAYGYYADGLVYDNDEKKFFYYTRGKDRLQHFQQLVSKPRIAGVPSIRKQSDGTSKREFMKKVNRVQKKVKRGETFQTVISRREDYSINGSMAPLYRELRRVCPSLNMHAVKMGDAESIGSFPELTLRIANGEAITYQVAGTRGRTGDREKDDAIFRGLQNDEKEVAEHMMLVDLARNDLARGSIPGTVSTHHRDLMHRLDAGPVMHLASDVRSRINGLPPLQALLNIAPMGTVSGAPKVRSMKIIYEEEEGEPRGLYAGSFGFVDMRGNLEAVVGLRSVMRKGKRLTIQAGAGIVYDSIAKKEYKETQQKTGVSKRVIEPFLLVS